MTEGLTQASLPRNALLPYSCSWPEPLFYETSVRLGTVHAGTCNAYREKTEDPAPPELSPPMRKLAPLVGRWTATIHWSEETHKLVGGPKEVEAEAQISWLGDGGTLHYQMGPSHWLIGRDETDEQYTVLYTD